MDARVASIVAEIRRQTERAKAERKNERKAAKKGGMAKKAPKKTRRKYTYSHPQPEVTGADGNPAQRPKVLTARDLVKMIPVDKSVYIVCNPEKAICAVKQKKAKGNKEVETVAKPRKNSNNTTLILTSKLQKGEDVDGILEEYQESEEFQQ